MIQDFVNRVISVFGKPIGILTDGEFHTKLWHNFCNSLMINKLRISPRSSKSNLAERMHRSLIKAIKIYREQKNLKAVDWPMMLPWSTLAWNHFPNSQGNTPAELFFGRRQKAPSERLWSTPVPTDTSRDDDDRSRDPVPFVLR